MTQRQNELSLPLPTRLYARSSQSVQVWVNTNLYGINPLQTAKCNFLKNSRTRQIFSFWILKLFVCLITQKTCSCSWRRLKSLLKEKIYQRDFQFLQNLSSSRKLHFPPCRSTELLPLSPLPLKAKLTSDGTWPQAPLGPVSLDLSLGAVNAFSLFHHLSFLDSPMVYLFSLYSFLCPSQGPLSLLSFFSSDTFFLGNYVIHFIVWVTV